MRKYSINKNFVDGLVNLNSSPNFLNKKRKESLDKQFAFNCGKETKEQNETKKFNLNDEKKITDFFKQKKKNYKNNNFSSKNLTDDEYDNTDQCSQTNSNSEFENLKYSSPKIRNNLNKNNNYKIKNDEENKIAPAANLNIEVEKSTDNSNYENFWKFFRESPSRIENNTKSSPNPKLKRKFNLNNFSYNKRLDKDIKEYFNLNESKLSNKTLITLRNLNFIKNSNETSPSKNKKIIISDLNFNSNNHRKSDKKIKDMESILKSLSMKDKYEGLLKRELILPPLYKLLFLQFSFLDETLIDLKFNKKEKTNLFKIQQECNHKDFKFGIELEDFQKMLFITPIFYLYKYETIKNIIIDIPEDIENRMKNNYQNYSNLDFQNLQSLEINRDIMIKLSEDNIKKRQNFFKDILMNLTKIQHNKFLKKNNIKFDPVKAGTWHSEFNLEDVTKIKLFSLVAKEKKTKRI